ncbi:transposase [Nonomuraea maritima]|uniref:transposase n=1 Tax=Nonomuraea maritima TaxID=683260 RepID=UPI000B098EF7
MRDTVRDDVREYVLEHLHDDDAVLVVDETGDVKKGTHSAGTPAPPGGSKTLRSLSTSSMQAAADTRRSTASCTSRARGRATRTRCRAAGPGEDTVFATKPEPAARMIGRFLDAGHRVGWVAGDEVYGGNPKLGAALEERQVGYVLAVACSAEVTTGAGKFRADALAVKVPKWAWLKPSAGAGGKGHRFYDWAVIDLAEPRLGSHQPLIRRNRTTGELAYSRCRSPAGAGRRVEMAGGGDLPVRKGPGRTGRAPGPPFHLVVSLGHPGHARPCLSRRRPR